MDFPPLQKTPPSSDLDPSLLACQAITLLATEPVVHYIQGRHDFDGGGLESLIFFCTNKKTIWATVPPLQLPRGPGLDRVGISFLRVDMATPRLTTPAAMAFGGDATKNVVDLPPDQCEAYLNREVIDLTPEQWRRCSGRGHLIVRYEGHPLGMGFLESTRSEDDNQGRLRSLYPRVWSSELDHISPFGNPR